MRGSTRQLELEKERERARGFSQIKKNPINFHRISFVCAFRALVAC